MKPEDVSDELVVAALVSYFDGGEKLDDFDPDEADAFRETLAAVLPAHEAMVRAKVVDDLLSIASEMEQMVNSAVTRHYASRIRVVLGEPSTCACFACIPPTPRGGA